MTAYYNENDPYAAQWLRNLIARGLIAPGDVDDRDIQDVRPGDLEGYDQCHWFAGIAGWSLALRMAGWPDGRPVWTGSCPCQPFSQAGQRKGFDDARHLWPVWSRLIGERRPATIFGEQVARASAWLALVRGDLEEMGYAVGAMPMEAASVGARHLRDRYWFVADSDGSGRSARQPAAKTTRHKYSAGAESRVIPDAIGGELRDESGWLGWAIGCSAPEPRDHGAAEPMADSFLPRLEGCPGVGGNTADELAAPERSGAFLADTYGSRCDQPRRPGNAIYRTRPGEFTRLERGEWNPWFVEPDVGRVAHGVSARVDKLRALGNAIVPQAAAEFIGAYLDAVGRDFLT